MHKRRFAEMQNSRFADSIAGRRPDLLCNTANRHICYCVNLPVFECFGFCWFQDGEDSNYDSSEDRFSFFVCSYPDKGTFKRPAYVDGFCLFSFGCLICLHN